MECCCHISGASYIHSEVFSPSDRRRHRQSRSTHPLHKPAAWNQPIDVVESNIILRGEVLNFGSTTSEWSIRKQLIQVLPKLQQLDGQQVMQQEKLEAGLQVSDDEDDEGLEEEEDDEEEEEEEEIDTVEGKGMFHDVTCGIVERSHERVKDVLRQHKDHMTKLKEVRSQSALTMAATPRLSSRMSERSDAD